MSQYALIHVLVDKLITVLFP